MTIRSPLLILLALALPAAARAQVAPRAEPLQVILFDLQGGPPRQFLLIVGNSATWVTSIPIAPWPGPSPGPTPVPVPVPPAPTPVPTPPPPAPTPIAGRMWCWLVWSAQTETPAQARLRTDRSMIAAIEALNVEYEAQEEGSPRLARYGVDKFVAATRAPCLIIQSPTGTVLTSVSLPATSAEILALVKLARGVK